MFANYVFFRIFAVKFSVINKMKKKDYSHERILLSDDQLEEVVGGAQSVCRPSWCRTS